MPTPIGHIASTLPLSALSEKWLGSKSRWPLYTLNACAAVLPDITYPIFMLSGIHFGHREWSHALIVAIPVACLFGWVTHLTYKNFSIGFLFCGFSFCSHIIFDMASSLTGPKILLPFSQKRFDLPFHFLPVAEIRIGSLTFNVICMFYEVALFLIICFFVKKVFRLYLVIALGFLLCGSIRQSNFRAYIWEQAPQSELDWYLENLDQFSPLHFSLFITPERESHNTFTTTSSLKNNPIAIDSFRN